MEQDLIMLERIWWLCKGLIEYMFSPYAWYRRLRGGTWVIHVYPDYKRLERYHDDTPHQWWIRISDRETPVAKVHR